MGILSVQSQVVSGHVGNAAAVFALQRAGREVWPVPTVLLSHHPGHGGAAGGPLPPDLLTSLLDGLSRRGCFADCEAIISGYLGAAETAAFVIEALHRARAAGSQPVYLCDPVLGDDGRTYVRPEIVTAMHNLAALSDILTPNAHELMLLSGTSPSNTREALQAMRLLQSRGPGIVVLTSFEGADTPPDMLEIIVADGPAAWRVTLPKLVQKFSGAGDLFAALFLHFWLETRDSRQSLGQTCAAVQNVLLQTVRSGADELALIAAQHQMLVAPQIFVPEREA
jgi:pyridoxine kinase